MLYNRSESIINYIEKNFGDYAKLNEISALFFIKIKIVASSFTNTNNNNSIFSETKIKKKK